MRNAQWIWGGICLAGWMLLTLVWAGEEAECRAADGLICFSTGEVVGLSAFLIACIWVAGALLIGAVRWVVARRR